MFISPVQSINKILAIIKLTDRGKS